MKCIKSIFLLLSMILFIQCTNKTEEKDTLENITNEIAGVGKLIASVKLNDEWFYINEHGEKLFDKTFTYASEFKDGISCVAEDGQRMMNGVVGAHYYGMNTNGERVDKLNSDMPFEFSEERAYLKQGERTYLVDTKGNVIKYIDNASATTPFQEARSIIMVDKDLQVWNKDGEIIKTLDNVTLSTPSDGLMLYLKQGKYGFMDKNGQVEQEAKYIDAFNFKDGLARIKEPNGELYYINKKFEKVLGPFDNGKDVSEGMIAVKQNDVWQFIDKEGNPITERKFAEVDSFSEGLAIVMKEDNTVGFINKKGEFTPIDARMAFQFNNGLAVAEKNEKLGFINTEGQWVIQPQYERVNNFNNL